MIVTTDKNSKHYNGNNFYDVWLNGGLVKSAIYADDVNGVVILLKVVPKIRRGKVRIVQKETR